MAELETPTTEQVRESVREKYATAANAVAAGAGSGCCTPADQTAAFGSAPYSDSGEADAPEAAVRASLGCGVPTAVADLHEGEVVLDLGSGAGADVLISARRVGPTGKAIGIDMTDEMLELARRNAASACVGNVGGEALAGAGLQDVEVRETHRVHEHAAAAIIRARKP